MHVKFAYLVIIFHNSKLLFQLEITYLFSVKLRFIWDSILKLGFMLHSNELH